MTISLSSTCSLFAFILGVIQKTITFQIVHCGLTLQEFDDIYNKEIAKRYAKHEIKAFIIKRKE